VLILVRLPACHRCRCRHCHSCLHCFRRCLFRPSCVCWQPPPHLTGPVCGLSASVSGTWGWLVAGQLQTWPYQADFAVRARVLTLQGGGGKQRWGAGSRVSPNLVVDGFRHRPNTQGGRVGYLAAANNSKGGILQPASPVVPIWMCFKVVQQG